MKKVAVEKPSRFDYIDHMTAAIILMVIGMGLTVGILATGLIAMVRGGEFNDKWGNRLMRMRIVAQMFALAMFALGLYLMRQGG